MTHATTTPFLHTRSEEAAPAALYSPRALAMTAILLGPFGALVGWAANARLLGTLRRESWLPIVTVVVLMIAGLALTGPGGVNAQAAKWVMHGITAGIFLTAQALHGDAQKRVTEAGIERPNGTWLGIAGFVTNATIIAIVFSLAF